MQHMKSDKDLYCITLQTLLKKKKKSGMFTGLF